MVNVVLFYGSNFISPSYTSIMVSSHFIIRRLTQFAASAWLLAATHRKYFGKKSVLSWEGSTALQSGGRWVMISTGVCVSWQHHSAQKVMNCVTGSPPCPLIGQHNPFKCSDWPSIFLQLCYSVSRNLVVVQFACIGWHLVPQLSPLIFDAPYQSIYWAGWGWPQYYPKWNGKYLASVLFEREIVKKDRDKMFTGTLHRMLNCILFVWC